MINDIIFRTWFTLRRLKSSKRGQAMTEYGLVIALIAVAVIVALAALGGKLTDLFKFITDSINVPTASS